MTSDLSKTDLSMADLSKTDLSAADSLDCPRCLSKLGQGLPAQTETYSSADPDMKQAWSCEACGGHFLDPASFRDVETTTVPKLLELRRIPGNEEQLQALSCPSCEAAPLMEKFRHPKDRQVVVDRCSDCGGIWLDSGEADAIREESLPVFLANTARYFLDLLNEDPK